MGETSIAWTDVTWNPLRGCSRVSEGCRNCYAEKIAARFSDEGKPFHGFAMRGFRPSQVDGGRMEPHWTGKVALVPEKLDEPLRWRKPRRVFVNSMSDLFHEKVSDRDIEAVFGVMATAGHCTFQVLTKRPERMREWVRNHTHEGCSAEMVIRGIDPTSPGGRSDRFRNMPAGWPWPLPNVHLGVSVEDQATADERIPILLETPAAVRFISAEPLLGPIDLDRKELLCATWRRGATIGRYLDWVIVGGESGPRARPMHPAWVNQIRRDCEETKTAFFFKQWGAWKPIDQPAMQDSPRRTAANEEWLNVAGGQGFHGEDVWRMRWTAGAGSDPSEWPEDLRVREFPGEVP